MLYDVEDIKKAAEEGDWERVLKGLNTVSLQKNKNHDLDLAPFLAYFEIKNNLDEKYLEISGELFEFLDELDIIKNEDDRANALDKIRDQINNISD